MWGWRPWVGRTRRRRCATCWRWTIFDSFWIVAGQTLSTSLSSSLLQGSFLQLLTLFENSSKDQKPEANPTLQNVSETNTTLSLLEIRILESGKYWKPCCSSNIGEQLHWQQRWMSCCLVRFNESFFFLFLGLVFVAVLLQLLMLCCYHTRTLCTWEHFLMLSASLGSLLPCTAHCLFIIWAKCTCTITTSLAGYVFIIITCYQNRISISSIFSFSTLFGFGSQTDSWQSSVSITVGCTFWSLPQGNFLEPFWKMDRFSFVFRAWKHQCVICRCPLYFPAGWQCRLNDICVGV